MGRILTIVGARPQFIKAAMVSRAINRHNGVSDSATVCEAIIHTGQHYDLNMSQIFFDEMEIPEPAANLGIGSGSHGDVTGRMIIERERKIHASGYGVEVTRFRFNGPGCRFNGPGCRVKEAG